MQLTEATLSVLRNFSEINKNLVVQKGKTLTTISEAKTIMGSAEIDIDFPQDFGIYDTSEFLSCLALIDTPSIDFDAKYLTIAGPGNKLKYFFSDPELLTKPNADSFTKMEGVFEDADTTVEIKEDQYLQLKRASATLKATRLSIKGDEKSIVASVSDPGNDTANSYSLQLKDYEGAPFEYALNMENLKIMRGDYEVTLSDKGLSRFKNTNSSMLYYIPLDKSKKD